MYLYLLVFLAAAQPSAAPQAARSAAPPHPLRASSVREAASASTAPPKTIRDFRPAAARAVVPAAHAQEDVPEGAPLAVGTFDTVLVLPEITITATRTASPAATAPARVTTLDREDFESTGAGTVADLLAARSTGFIRFYGSGGLATLSLRGASPSQTLLLVDGQRLSDPQTGQVDLALLPTLLLQEVEIVHGSGSALYGSDGFAGVINMRALHGGSSGIQARVGGGAFGERLAAARADAVRGRWQLAAATEASRSDGDFVLGTDAASRSGLRRLGADRTQFSGYATARYRGSASVVTVSGWHASAERGLPGPVTTAPVGERQWDQQSRIWVNGRMPTVRGEMTVAAAVHAASLRYLNPQLQLDQTGTSLTRSLEGTWSTGGRAISITTGAAFDYSTAQHPSRQDAGLAHAGIFGAGSWEIGGAHFHPAVRVDVHEAPDSPVRAAISPRIGVSTPGGLSSLRAKASVGRSFRVPTLNERYWQPGGNPHLRPERGWTVDAGLVHRTRHAAVELSSFISWLADEIMWSRTATGYYAPENLRRVRSVGMELSADGTVRFGTRRVDGGFVASLVDARDRSDPKVASFDHQLRYVPRSQLKCYASLYLGNTTVDVSTRYVGRRFVTSDGTQSMNPHLVADLQVRTRWRIGSASATMAVSLQNLFDAEYAVLRHYPMPPRHLRASITIDTH